MSDIKYIHQEEVHNTSAAEVVLPYLFSLFKPESVIDIGCGTGSWLSIAKKNGVTSIKGIDGIHVNTDMLRISEKEFMQHDLTSPLNLGAKYDMAICLEVAEHLPPEDADNIIELIITHSDLVPFSAAIPGQGGQYHFNEQWPDYWQDKFAKRGFLTFDILREKFWSDERVDWWYRQNMLIYARPEKQAILNSLPVEKIKRYIHQELLSLKQDEINSLSRVVRDKIWDPKFLPSLKILKSIIK